MRAKMKVSSVTPCGETAEKLTFSAVGASSYGDDGSDENNTYAKYTPSASVELTVANPELLGKFVEGECYYVDFTKVDE